MGEFHKKRARYEPKARILKMDDPAESWRFERDYNIKDHNKVDWEVVSADYDGIYFDDYDSMKEHNFLWYGWDVASVCIWDKSKVHIQADKILLV